MPTFFEQARQEGKKKFRKAVFELPILYFRDDFFGLFFLADEEKIRGYLPSDSLYPVSMGRGRVCVGIAAFNYVETSIGPYGEVGIVLPVVHGRKPIPFYPMMREGAYPGFGLLVLHLPVTTLKARDGGRGVWGFPKFTADMVFSITPEFMECELSEKKNKILSFRVYRGGTIRQSDLPMITYTVKKNKMIKTTIPQIGLLRDSIWPKDFSFDLGNHPIADELNSLNLSDSPILSRYSLERSAILPSGEVIESNVRPLEGYAGTEKEGSIKIKYNI